MTNQTIYINEYLKDPFSVDLKVHSMKAGLYHVAGEISGENWQKACEDMAVEEGGSCFIDVEIEKKGGFLFFKGSVNMETNRTCVRTLEEFSLKEDFEFDDRLCLAFEKAEDMDEVFTEETLHLKEFLLQQLIVNMEAYPVHPKTLAAEDGAFDVTDGLEKEVEEEKNPFSVLKHLKS